MAEYKTKWLAWDATCGKCGHLVKWSDYRCDNCNKGNIKTTGHSSYLSCDNCSAPFSRQLLCPSCQAVIYKWRIVHPFWVEHQGTIMLLVLVAVGAFAYFQFIR